MIQPLHLLLYTILVTSAYELVSKSPIYAIVAVGFMMPAEKLLRKFFGFDKAQTPGLLGGAAGAAFAMAGLQRLGKGKSKGGKSGGSEDGKSKDKNVPKLRNKSNIDPWAGIRDQIDPATEEENVKLKNLLSKICEHIENVLPEERSKRNFSKSN